MTTAQPLKGGRNAKRRHSRKNETALEREERLNSARVAAQRRREQKRIDEREKLRQLSRRALDAVEFSREDIELVAAGQQYTKDPRLALMYYYCCGPDPRGFVFGDEQLNGENGEEAQDRLKDMFNDFPKPENVGACQRLASELESEAVDIWACASCGRILLSGGGSDKVVVKSLVDLPSSFRLTDEEIRVLFDGVPDYIVKQYRQVWFDGDDVYFLIPELVKDTNQIPFCVKCSSDPRKNPFSVASGHDYGRIQNLPALNDIALSCISPVRCFGTEISISGKHSSGHAICFPSDGPTKVAEVLPRTDPGCIPRVTFVGPREEWRIQKKKYRKLYSIRQDDVYRWLSVLAHVNDIFRAESILVDDSSERRRPR